MDSNRRAALTAGVLFIVATAASLLSTAIERPVVTGADYLTRIADNVSRVSAGGLLELVAAGASAGIAIALYPVLRNQSRGLALGSVVFRALEATGYAAGAVITLSLLKVAGQYTTAAADHASIRAIGDALAGVRQDAILAAVFAFVLGALMYYVVFYRTRLVPRWLSGWGILAELLMLAACLSALFTQHAVTSYTLLALPIAVQEMVLALWLIVRGFSPAAAASSSAQRSTSAPPAPQPSPGKGQSWPAQPAPRTARDIDPAPVRQR